MNLKKSTGDIEHPVGLVALADGVILGLARKLAGEASALTDLEASLERRPIVTGSLAVALAQAVAVFFGSSAGSSMTGTGNPLWLAEQENV